MDVRDWLQSAIKVAQFLPLEQRKKQLNNVMSLLSDEQIAELIQPGLKQPKWVSAQGWGASVQGARFLAHFLGGEGEPWELDLSDDEWEELINSEPTRYSMTKEERELDDEGLARGRDLKGVWKPSTNPKFPHSEGWEHKQIHVQAKYSLPEDHPRKGLESERASSIHDAIGGETSIRRRKLDDGGYEYQIAEDFDLTTGSKEYWEEAGGERNRFDWYNDASGNIKSTRPLPDNAANMLYQLFPTLMEKPTPYETHRGKRMPGTSNVNSMYRLAEAGTAFPIISSYFTGKSKVGIEDLLMNLFKGW